MRASIPMLSRTAVAVLAAISLASPLVAGESPDATKEAPKSAEQPKKLKRPGFELRVSPRYSFSPANVLFTAELKGGDDVEEYYCPEVEWEWGDGTKSVQEADCDPWEAATKIERRFTNTHLFETSGVYVARITLRKGDKTVVTKSIEVTVHPGTGDQDVYGGN